MSKDIIDSKKIQKIANLAKISIDKEFEPHFVDQLNNIISWFDKLNEKDVSQVQPLMNVNEMDLEMFEDKVVDGEITEEILKNAPDARYNYFAVPKVIE